MIIPHKNLPNSFCIYLMHAKIVCRMYSIITYYYLLVCLHHPKLVMLLLGRLEEYSPRQMTVVNYLVWVVGAGLILFIVIALIVIYFIHKSRHQKEKMAKMLARRRKATDYRRPGFETPETMESRVEL